MENILPIEPLTQGKGTNDCYAAVTAMVYNFYNNENPKTLKTIKTKIIEDLYKTPQERKKALTQDQDPCEYLFKNHLVDKVVPNSPRISFEIVKREIDNSRPIICLIGAHYILFIGYKEENIGRRRSNEYYYFIDPYVNEVQEILQSDFEKQGIVVDKDRPIPKKQISKGVVLSTAEHLNGYILTKPPNVPCQACQACS